MAARAVALIGLVMQIATSAQPPALLQIVREPLKPGSEAAFNAIEEERARISATLGCPHPTWELNPSSGRKRSGGLTVTSHQQSGSRFTTHTRRTHHLWRRCKRAPSRRQT